jgi:signal transduction histidine kinase/AmiR/NasT family two-component response regulator
MARTRARLLVVEEEREAIRLATSLMSHGFDVTVASGRTAATEAIARFRFDVALSGTPRDGDTSLLETLKAADPQMEVVVSASTPGAASDLVRGGAFACVAKPYDLIEVRALIDSAVHASSRLFGCVTLYEASRTLLATLKQADLAPLIVTLANRVMPSDGVGLVLTGSAAPMGFECHTSHRVRDLSRGVLIQLAAAVSSAGHPVVCPSDAPLPDGCADMGIATLASFPLAAVFGPLGALVFFRPSGAPAFSQAEIDRGQGFAAQVSLALENAQTYREVEDKMRSLLRNQDQAQIRARIAAAGEVGGGLAHDVNNPLAALACNLDALRSFSSDVASLWGAAKAAAEFLVEQAEPTGQRLAKRVLGDAGNVERTDRMVTEVACAIDECLSGVQRIADLVRTLHDTTSVRPRGVVAVVSLGELLEGCRDARRGRARRTLDVVCAPGASFAEISRDDVETGIHNLLDALDRIPRARQPVAVLVESSSFTITDHELSLTDTARLSEAGGPVVTNVALDCALAAAFQLFERNGATLTLEEASPSGTRVVVTFPTKKRG